MDFKKILKWLIVNILKPILVYLVRGYLFRWLKILGIVVVFIVTCVIVFKGC